MSPLINRSDAASEYHCVAVDQSSFSFTRDIMGSVVAQFSDKDGNKHHLKWDEVGPG